MANTNKTEIVRIIDDWVIFSFISACLFGIVTNLLSIFTLLNMPSQNKHFKRSSMYKYMLAMAVSDFAYLLQLGFIYPLRSSRSPYKNTYMMKSLDKWLLVYFTSSLAVFSICLEIAIALNRYFCMSNESTVLSVKNHCLKKLKSSNWTILLLFLFSIISQIPFLLARSIVRINPKSEQYTFFLNDFGKTSLCKFFIYFCHFYVEFSVSLFYPL